MANKEINVFSVSFLDLLSGALGAVLILFIIVPKMSEEQRQTIQEVEELRQQTERLDELTAQAENSVSSEVYEQIRERLENMRETLDNLTHQVSDLQRRLGMVTQENEELRNALEETRRQLEEARREAEQHRNASDGRIFGMNAELGVVCSWPENVDVDLYVKNLSSGTVCYFHNQHTAFGNLMEDITSRTSTDDDRYELFYQRKIVPGRYLIYVNIYRQSRAPATVNGYIVLFPGKRNEKKIPYREIRLNETGTDTEIGMLEVTETTIYLQQP